MSYRKTHRAFSIAACLAIFGWSAAAAHAADLQIKRGEYLVKVMGCTDCHTAGSFFGHPNMKQFLAGSDVGFAIPNLGVFVGSNLTPDKETGLGNWTTQQIVTAITTGTRPDGRVLAPSMPWMDFAHLTKSDALAIATYVKSLPPVKNAVPGPFGPTEAPTSFVMPIIPADIYMKLPKPPAPTTK